MISVDEALTLILQTAGSFGTEKVSLDKAFGRVLAGDVRADRDYPPFNRSAMDGFAVATSNYVAEKTYSIGGAIFAGDTPSPNLARLPGRQNGDRVALKIMTGAAVPPEFDAVIRKEDAAFSENEVRFEPLTVSGWHNIARRGEDLKKDQSLSLSGAIIDSMAATVLASLGAYLPTVQKTPQVTIITTGNEIVTGSKKPQVQQIRNSNVFALKAQLIGYGINKVTARHVADDRDKLTAVIGDALTSDIILLTGGVSAGDSDYVPEILAQLKVKKVFHKVALKPGKPLWFGMKGKTRVFAIPGNPFSAQVVFKIFIEPYLHKCFGMNSGGLFLPLAAERRKKDSLRQYFPVKIQQHGGLTSQLEAIPYNGSGDIRAGLFSDGLAMHPADMPELNAGSIVSFLPWRIL